MYNRKPLQKLLAPAILALSLAWLPQPAIADTSFSTTNDPFGFQSWPQEPEWVALTNFITVGENEGCPMVNKTMKPYKK